MQEQNTYGTGRNPEKARSHTATIALLLLAFAATHLLAFVSSRNEGNLPDSTDSISLAELIAEDAPADPPTADCCGLGLQLSELTEPQQRYWSLPNGVYVESIDTAGCAYEGGLRAGDVLLRVGETSVSDIAGCLDALRFYQTGDTVSLTYYRGGEQYCTAISLPRME